MNGQRTTWSWLEVPMLWRWLLLAIVAGGAAVLLHGCHGDEDNELFVPSWVQK